VKKLLVIFLLIVALLLIFGSPIAGKKPLRTKRYNSPEPILPMTFAHQAHGTVNCLVCHHNFVDDTGKGMCMTCHTGDKDLWPRLESQFHGLCRSCHAKKAAEDIEGGPPGKCVACHLEDDLP